MDRSAPEWRELVSDFAASLSTVQDLALPVAALPSDALESPMGDALEGEADAHLMNTQRVRAYLSHRLGDADAQDALGRVLLADLHVAQLIDATTGEPLVASDEVVSLTSELNVQMIRADLLGGEVAGGAEGSSVAIDVATKSCNNVIERAEGCAKDLFGSVASSLTVADVLSGVESIVGKGAAAHALEELSKQAGRIKRKVLRFLEEAVEKLAKLLGRDPDKVKKELKELWAKLTDGATDWAEDALGRARAASSWKDWLGSEPPPTKESVDSALSRVASSERSHRKQLDWACSAVKVFGWIDDFLAAIKPQGPPIVVAIAAGLAGWMVLATWDHLRDVAAAAA
jgi:hypothetical protein